MTSLALVKNPFGTPASMTAPLSLSKIRSATDNRPEPFTTTWPELIEAFRVPVVRGDLAHDAYLSAEKAVRDQQKDGPAIIPGAFSKPDTRKQEDQASLSIVTLDIDESARTFDELCAALQGLGLECLIHTSYSHSLDKPKHRAFVLLKQPITIAIKATLERILDFFDDRIGSIDPCCRKPGQLFFTPACPPGGEALYQFRHLAGTPLDPADFPEVPAQPHTKAASTTTGTPLKPGEDYNDKAPWSDLLEPLGWSKFYSTGNVTQLTRPGKTHGVSATIFHDSKNLYIHSSAPEVQPFECGKNYTPFGAYALVNHGGDHIAAARELGRQGYGEPAAKQTSQESIVPEVMPAVKAGVPAVVAARVIDITEWGAERWTGEPPARRYLVSGRIPLGVAVMVAAMGDTGKSFILLSLALLVATGKDLLLCMALGGYVEEHGTAVVFTAEEDAGEIHSRLAALDPHGRRFKYPGKLLVIPLPDAGGPLSLVMQTREGLKVTPEFDMLRKQLVAIPDLKMVVFDPLQNFVQTDINADPAAGQFACAVFAQLAAETGATVVLPHHMRKSPKPIETVADARDAIRGTTALVDGLRAAYALWPVADAEAKKICRSINVIWQPNRVVAGAVVKANGKADRGISTFIRDECGVLRDASAQIEAVENKNGNQGDLLLLLEMAIKDKAIDEQPFTKTGKNGVFDRKAELPEALQVVSKSALSRMVEDLEAAGRIVKAIHNGTIKQWLDVPAGPFAAGTGSFRKGA